ncbi:MAG: HAMP domain-containing sensor histidine kinase [Candidatus Latescibacterota bacterium]
MPGDAVAAELIPIERELQERLGWFIGMRWIAAGAILLGTWMAVSFVAAALPAAPMYGVGVAVLAGNGAFSLLRRRLEGRLAHPAAYRRFVYAQIALDWTSLTCLVHLSGGIHSPVALAFTFHLIIGAILLSQRACYLLVTAAALLLGALALAEALGAWAPARVEALAVAHPAAAPTVLYRWLSLVGVFAVAALLSTSITARLREKEQTLFRSEQAMEALYRLGQVVNSTTEVDHVLGLIAENGARLAGMKACSIRLLDASGKRLHLASAFGLSQAYLAKGAVEVSRSPIAAEVLSGKVVQVLDVASDHQWLQYPEEAQHEGICSVLCVPMQSRGRSIGLVRVYSGTPHHFSPREVGFLRNLANLGAVAIENARNYADLRALTDEKAWFAHVAVHQFRSPAAAVYGLLEALVYAGPLSAKQGDLVRRCQRRVKDLLDMIAGLLDLAAAQHPHEGQAVEAVPLFDCLQSVLETVLERADCKGVRLRVEGAGLRTPVRAAAEDVRRIFSNLLDNGVKYTPAGGQVTFRVERVGDRVRAEVTDTGMGIAEADQERVFDGFYRTEAAKASGEAGTGLGLSIVKQLVERWQGSIELHSSPGCGTCVSVVLPGAPGRPAG